MPYAVLGGFNRRLLRISVEDMNKILKDPTRCGMIGCPTYFDETKRVWPKPEKKFKIVWDLTNTSDAR